MQTFQQIILALQAYWDRQGCALLQPYDMEVGAGTSHTATFLRALGPEPWRAAYVQPSRRPKDGRYGENPNRLSHYYQYQVVLKPAPGDILDRYLGRIAASLVRSICGSNTSGPTIHHAGRGCARFVRRCRTSRSARSSRTGRKSG